MSGQRLCQVCGKPILKRKGYSQARYEQARFCSRACWGIVQRGEPRAPTPKPIQYLKGEAHPSWKGGRTVDSSGYVRVRMASDHPFVSMRLAHGYVQEHRLVVAEHLGRPLHPWETVHHRNGVRDDNRIENLELRMGRHGAGAELCCADCGSRNLIPC